jgi:CheY-like chemotaxis protein
MEAIGQLAGGIAHDINNILTSIWGHAQLLGMRFPDPSGADSVQGILKGCERARDLARQILLFGRKQDPLRLPVRVEEILKETFELLRAWAPGAIRLEADVPPDLPPVLGDPGQLHQVLMNLCTNAVHAMQEGPGLLKVRLEARSDSWIHMEVSDTGTGITAQMLPRIFEPFFTTKGPDKGTGLGLSVVHGIVRNHGGTIEVRSVPGQGTTFVVSLPIQMSVPENPVPAQHGMPHGRGELVLVVDDEPAITDILANLLEILGYRCKAFTRPRQALDEFRLDPGSWSAVISDYTMPDLTGKELAREIHRVNPGIPVLLTSGYESFDQEDDSVAKDIFAFVPKPFQAEDIASLLQNCMSKR